MRKLRLRQRRFTRIACLQKKISTFPHHLLLKFRFLAGFRDFQDE